MASATQKEDKERGPENETPANEPSLNMEELRELARLVDEHGFTEFEFENEKIRVRLGKNTFVPAPAYAAPAVQNPAPAQPAAEVPAAAAEESETEDEGLYQITSPIVGTFYSSPAPDKPAFVKEGDKVSDDTVVCIVEAMKLMNEIQAEVSGEIVKVYVENAQPVEFGQPLFGIKQ